MNPPTRAELEAMLRDKDAQIARLQAELKLASIESISARCQRTQVQCCHVCDRSNCGDNRSPMVVAARQYMRRQITAMALMRIP